MVHRQESVGLLGLPFGRFIDVEDSEQVLQGDPHDAARRCPSTSSCTHPGGLVLASDQIAYALKRHQGKVTVLVPHYAMSGGTLVALAADAILMDADAVLGPVDPQLGNPLRGMWPAASILAALEEPNPNRDDQTLILGDVSRKAIAQVRDTVEDLVRDRLPERAAELAATLSEGRWTHDYPIRVDEARRLGLPVDEGAARRGLRAHGPVPAPHAATAVGRVHPGAVQE